MNSFRGDILNVSSDCLIDWKTPEVNKTKNMDENHFTNNPFDVIELEAASMDPFDLAPYNISSRIEPPCGIILSPLWEPQDRQIQKSVSLTGIDDIVHSPNEQITPNDRSQTEKESFTIDIKQDCVQDLKPGLSSSCSDLNKSDIYLPCNEEEIKQLKEQTRQRIEMLIEASKKQCREKHRQNSFYKHNEETSLNKTDCMLNKAFYSNSISCISRSTNKINEMIDINDNNTSSLFLSAQEYNSFDLNALKPEWVTDNFSDADGSHGSFEISKIDNNKKELKNVDAIDIKLKALSRIGIANNKIINSQTVVKSKTKPLNTKGPFVAHIPVKDMVQGNYSEDSMEEKKTSPEIQIKPIAASTPTLSGMGSKTPLNNTFAKSQSLRKSLPSPRTPLLIKEKNIKNTSLIKPRKMSTPNSSSIKNCTNSTVVLNKDIKDKNAEVNKTKTTTKTKALPGYKRFVYKGKENVKP
ncbi:uncharacterized protein LOC126840677 [Adelges cooleyi]|uniref:uncharacterized protein LOC126840677 n=1 Tax=Adelges cooleyi TaxID=133065 RepID=UPI0021806902|nr:uncharacterized protein LOC126840677 [Adelges cooleyi]XP_050432526.1 uncharacterized protein LOC126840677 [Adelges cooleyi]XP_050432527.1 uncharacterized protein LOC126840677 [Adelges cooleyi]